MALNPRVILFDLDGTLVDTAPDLGLALNIQLKRHGYPALPISAIRPYASHGSKGLLKLGFGLTPEHASFDAMRVEYLNLYDEVFLTSPTLFEGMADVLAAIEANGQQWGIVTNKPKRFTQRLIDSMGLDCLAGCVVSGDDAPRPKPYPDTLNLACEQLRVKADDCIYVGDAARDIEAGKAAGMKTVVALYGYIEASDHAETWGGDFYINQPKDLMQFI
ncbi:MAG: HAD family hydrolase [Methylophilaceae bacterium]